MVRLNEEEMVGTIIINQIIFIALNILLAWYHARLIKQGKKIYHGRWAAGIAGLMAAFAAIDLWYIPVLLFLRLLIFGAALNLFRHLPIEYTNPNGLRLVKP